MTCLALNQREKCLTIAHGQQHLLRWCSPVSLRAALRHGWGKQGTQGGSRVSTDQRLPGHVGIYKTSLIAPPATEEMGRMRTMTGLVQRAAPAIAAAQHTLTFFSCQEHQEPAWFRRVVAQVEQAGGKPSKTWTSGVWITSRCCSLPPPSQLGLWLSYSTLSLPSRLLELRILVSAWLPKTNISSAFLVKVAQVGSTSGKPDMIYRTLGFIVRQKAGISSGLHLLSSISRRKNPSAVLTVPVLASY